MTTTDVEHILRAAQLGFTDVWDVAKTEGIDFILKIYLVVAPPEMGGHQSPASNELSVTNYFRQLIKNSSLITAKNY